jgi:hypothetical protein
MAESGSMRVADRLALDLGEEAVLLALGARRARLRLVVRAAAKSDDGQRRTANGVLRSLKSQGLVTRVRRGRYEATPAAGVADLQLRLGTALWGPQSASARDVDFVVLSLLSGTFNGRQRRLARDLMVILSPERVTPMITWLLHRYRAATVTELADAILRELPWPRHFEEGAFDSGISAGLSAGWSSGDSGGGHGHG